jgi:hypothetical protein
VKLAQLGQVDSFGDTGGLNLALQDAVEFSTAAFRIGHEQLNGDIRFLDNSGKPIRPALDLTQAFDNPVPLEQVGIDPILKYLASDNAQEVNTQVIDQIRNMLFGPPGSGGQDLLALDIQRGRDHGLADYNTIRQAYGLLPVTNFDQITSDPDLRALLQELYGDVDHIDVFIGGLAEDHLPGASVGPTFQAILVDQFQRTRDGDRLWFENVFSGADLDALENVTLADIIKWNTNLTSVQDNAFFFPTTLRATGRTIDATAGQQLHPILASFLDVGPTPGLATDYRAVINWGDQTDQDSGDIALLGDGSYEVAAYHTYAAPGTYTVTIVITDTRSDAIVAAFSTITVTIPQPIDPGFEQPPVGTGTDAYQYNPTGSWWDFSGTSGVAGNGSFFTEGNPDAPEGSQVAFLQGQGSISQLVDFAAGTYTLSLSAAQRATHQDSYQTFAVLIDDRVVDVFKPDDTNYATYTASNFTVTGGTHTIKFVGLNPNGGDNTALIDDVLLTFVS